jgi:hypothetical protein
MMERAKFIEYKGVPILYMDVSNCTIEEAHEVIREATPMIRKKPEKTVLTLTYTEGSRFDSEVINALKEFTKGNEPYVKAAAVVGVKGLQKVILDAVSLFSSREFATFDDIEEAKEYLVNHA